MTITVASIPGDGIGPDVVHCGLQVLQHIASKENFSLHIKEVLMGGVAIDTCGQALPEETIKTCRNSDAVLLGAVGGPAWDSLPGNKRPEAGLLQLRASLGVFGNLRPAFMFPQLAASCPLKEELVRGGLDILVVRELTGGLYFGDRGRSSDGEVAWDTEKYSAHEIDRLLQLAFDAANKRNKKLCIVDKANVLESSRLWRERAEKLRGFWPEIELSYMYVDNCAMQLVRRPQQFDVIATSNMFGDILSDEASMLTGSIGMLPSASVGYPETDPVKAGRIFGLYEPIHGSAPDIAGKNLANPIATILSVALMLQYSLAMPKAGRKIEEAVSRVLDQGYRCQDIASANKQEKIIGTKEMGAKILEALDS